jgi:hypothetical protein
MRWQTQSKWVVSQRDQPGLLQPEVQDPRWKEIICPIIQVSREGSP